MSFERLKYSYVVGTGGIGSGILFNICENETLGRNESRLAELSGARDFCKQHIILHYIARLLIGSKNHEFSVHPIGCVGEDSRGRELIDLMKLEGMDISRILKIREKETLFSVCFQYPDGSGGNLTSINSASNSVETDLIDHWFKFKNTGKGIVIAAPEVPLQTRLQLLVNGRLKGCLNTASVASAEMDDFVKFNGLCLTDILFLNKHEAAVLSGMTEEAETSKVIQTCIQLLVYSQVRTVICITNGENGSYVINNRHSYFIRPVPVQAVATPGAGDAYMAGTITGLCLGLPLLPPDNTESLSDKEVFLAGHFGTLLASLSVMVPDTINFDIDWSLIADFAARQNIALPTEIVNFINFK